MTYLPLQATPVSLVPSAFRSIADSASCQKEVPDAVDTCRAELARSGTGGTISASGIGAAYAVSAWAVPKKRYQSCTAAPRFRHAMPATRIVKAASFL